MSRSADVLAQAVIGRMLLNVAVLACGQVPFEQTSLQLSFSRPASSCAAGLGSRYAALPSRADTGATLSSAFPFYGLTSP